MDTYFELVMKSNEIKLCFFHSTRDGEVGDGLKPRQYDIVLQTAKLRTRYGSVLNGEPAVQDIAQRTLHLNAAIAGKIERDAWRWDGEVMWFKPSSKYWPW